MTRSRFQSSVRRAVRALLVALAAEVLFFVGATVSAEVAARGVASDATSIVTNAMPSVKNIAEARTDLRRLAGELDEAAAGVMPPARLLHDHIRIEEQGIAAALARYEAAPRYPGEARLYRRAKNGLPAIYAGVGAVESKLVAGDLEGARADLPALHASIAATDLAFQRVQDLNADNGARLGDSIVRRRDASLRDALILDGVAILLTGVLALLAARVVRSESEELARRAEELELFAGRVAHDVLSPLQSTVLSIDTLARRSLGEREQALLVRARRGALHTREIVDGLLAFARAGAHPEGPGRAEVKTVLDDLREEVGAQAEEAGVRLTIEPFEPCSVHCEPSMLSVAVANLLRNAIKYGGGTSGAAVAVRVARAGQAVRVEVEDNGPGLPEGLEGKLFEPFVRGAGSDKPGIGLGLATVRRIAEAHGGRVGVESRPGRGCTFWFELPAVQGA